jgi:hypothetical protein
MMKFFLKAVITGFAWSLGSALFKKIQRQVGLGDPAEKNAEIKQDGASDPDLQHHVS